MSARAFSVSINAAKPRWKLMELTDIETLPAIQWKLANIEKMSPDKRHAACGRSWRSDAVTAEDWNA